MEQKTSVPIRKSPISNRATKLIALTYGVLVTCFLVGYFVFAWTEPSAPPPTTLVSPPINVGSTAQTKAGDLTVQTTLYGDDIRLGNWGGVVTASGDIDIKNSGGNVVIQLDGDTGNVNVSGVYQKGGTSGVSATCGSGNTPSGITISGGIITSAGSCTAIGGGAPTDASYVVMGLNGNLTSERVLTAGTGISISDGGPNGNVTISHTDTSSQSNVDNSGNTFIQDISLDTYGHLTGLTSATVSESDPQVGSLTSGKWCTTDGSAVNCTSDAPGGVGGSGTATQVAFFTAGTTISSDSGLYWDNTNKRLGIGTTGPSYKLDVNGDIRAQNAWLRTTGNTGWYSDTYGGGWYMADSTWVRSYGSKDVYVDKMVRADNGFQVDGNQVIDSDAGWHRTWGQTGIYFSSYGNGIYPRDSTFVGVYPNDKYFRANYIYQDGPGGYVTSINGTLSSGYVPRADGSYRITNGTIYDNGNIGIGTTSPGYKLHVEGAGYFSGNLSVGGNLSVSGNFVSDVMGWQASGAISGQTTSTGRYYPKWICAITRIAGAWEGGGENCNVYRDASNQWKIDYSSGQSSAICTVTCFKL